ncbi:hypothetical protein MKW98_007245 [Papaver atlanticum]|uniref:Pentatricopeptide repeat-containing protein n=1 Tax=Papaver atlanticum TaxID=357466 RepID=A0AAD4T821_9MAGN|nr:hypothetical protein MKW98_007245 [Papaver atlanticum]
MAYLSRLRFSSQLNPRRYFSSILNPDSSTPLTSKQKSKAALSLLKSEKNPEKILDICRAASLHPDYPLDRTAFVVAISKLTDSKSFDGIRCYLEKLKARPDLKNERFHCNAIVYYGRAGMLDHSIKTFQEMGDLGIAATTKSLNALLSACIASKKYDEVNRIFLEYPDSYNLKPDVDTYNAVIKGFCESGSSNSVYSVLDEMEKKGCRPNSTTFGTIFTGIYKENFFADVEKVLEIMKKHGVSQGVAIYNIRILGLCKYKSASEGKALFEEMLLRGVKPNAVSFHHLIHGFSKERKFEEAKRLLNDMAKHGCAPNNDCYFSLVYYLCQGGDFVSALEFCKESMSKGWFPNFSTMKMLVNGLVSSSKVDEAKDLIGQVKEKFPNKADQWKEIEEGLAPQ